MSVVGDIITEATGTDGLRDGLRWAIELLEISRPYMMPEYIERERIDAQIGRLHEILALARSEDPVLA